MRKLKIVVYALMMIVCLSACGTKGENQLKEDSKIDIAVSIVPQETFVKAVGGDLVHIVTMIPQGYSPANYAPTPKQMAEFSESEIYFSIGVAAEESNILGRVDELNSDIKIVSMNEKVKEVFPERIMEEDVNHEDDEDEHDEHQHEHSGRDPHIWLSPKRVKVMIECIKDELIEISPNNKAIFEINASKYITELDKVDKEIKELLKDKEIKSFIIYHPSFGYFAEEYGLNMIAIEEGGKKATAKSIEKVISKAKSENIKVIFYQDEFDSGQAEIVANEIDGITVNVSALDGEYIKNLKNIALKFKEALQ